MSYTLRNILVPIDLSEASLNAFRIAISIAKKNDVGLHIVNVIEHDHTGKSNDDSNFTDILNALVESVHHSHEIKPVLTRHEGNVNEVVIHIATNEDCDLIVTGTHGASGYRNGFIGSNTYNILKYARCPVITIPPGYRSKRFQKVVFPIRPVTGALSKYHVMRAIISDVARIDVLGLPFLSSDKNMNILQKIIDEVRVEDEKAKINMRGVWGAGGNISDDISEYIAQTSPDLVIITDDLDATIKPFYIGPHAQKVINVSKAPILQIKNSQAADLNTNDSFSSFSYHSLM